MSTGIGENLGILGKSGNSGWDPCQGGGLGWNSQRILNPWNVPGASWSGKMMGVCGICSNSQNSSLNSQNSSPNSHFFHSHRFGLATIPTKGEEREFLEWEFWEFPGIANSPFPSFLGAGNSGFDGKRPQIVPDFAGISHPKKSWLEIFLEFLRIPSSGLKPGNFGQFLMGIFFLFPGLSADSKPTVRKSGIPTEFGEFSWNLGNLGRILGNSNGKLGGIWGNWVDFWGIPMEFWEIPQNFGEFGCNFGNLGGILRSGAGILGSQLEFLGCNSPKTPWRFSQDQPLWKNPQS